MRALIFASLLLAIPACSLFGKPDTPPGADSALGEVVWSYPSSPPLGQNDVRAVIDGTVAGGGTAYVAHARQVDAVDLASGERRWTTPVPSANPYPIVSSALVDFPDRVVLNDFHEVHGFDKATGRRLWKTTVGDYAGLEFVVMGQDERHVYLPGLGEVVQIAVADGAIVRRFQLPPDLDPLSAEGERLAKNPAVAGGVLFVPDSRGPRDDARYGDVVAFDVATGEILWDEALPVYYEPDPSTPDPDDEMRADSGGFGLAVSDGLVVVSTTLALHALDAATGVVRWSAVYPDAEAGFWEMPTVADGAVYAGTSTRWLYRHDLATGAEEWRYRVNGSFTALAEVDGDRVWVTDEAFGQVHVVEAATGRRLWVGRPPGDRVSRESFLSPVAVGGGMAVVASTKGVYGIAAPR